MRGKTNDFEANKKAIQSLFVSTPVSTKTKDVKLKRKLKQTNNQIIDLAKATLNQKILSTQDESFLEAEGMEKTWKFSQKELSKNLDLQTKKNQFALNLNFGPYKVNYSRNSQSILLQGKKGHLAQFEHKSKKLLHQLNTQELNRDSTFLHNDTMYAVAQKKYSFIYDKTGMELHCLKDFIEVNALEYLPYHFLLASIGNAGYLKYLDTSTGRLVSTHRTKLGSCSKITQNPYNAIINLGHANGTVTLWSPALQTPLVKILCHRGPITGISCDFTGHYMSTCGLDGQLKVWDIRTYKELDSYYTPTPPSCITYSQKGLLGVASNGRITVWKDLDKQKQKEPYMTELLPSCTIENLNFCPFEDILGVGHSNGFSSIVIPGSGEGNFDTMEQNPYQTVKQRQEDEVHQLLNKIQPGMIQIDPDFVGKVDRTPKELMEIERKKEFMANNPKEKFKPVKKKRGKSSSQRRYLRKQGNVLDEKREELKEKLKKEKNEKMVERMKRDGTFIEDKNALNRFKI